jgi:uncharacterized protein
MFDTPGVYPREIPSGVRSISGVATSNTAFVGCFARGPVNVATRITSLGEFERVFGGLAIGFESAYAVRTYFLNGGSIAFIVRVTAGVANTASAQIGGNTGVTLAATSPGTWGNALRVGIARAAGAPTTFNLLVREYRGTEVIREEAFSNLSITAGQPRYVTTVLAAESELVRCTAHVTGNLPAATQVPINGVNGPAVTMDQLQEAPVTSLLPLATTAGTDGTLPGNTDGWRDAIVASIGGSAANNTGINALETIVPDVFNLLCLPDLSVLDHARMGPAALVYQQAHAYCLRKFAFLIVDSLADTSQANVLAWTAALGATVRRSAALYYPKLIGPDPLNPAVDRVMASSGAVAGIYARTDAARGVWKAPAGTEAGLAGGRPREIVTDRQQGPMNVQGINVLRTFPVYNSIVWGARTLEGADALASEWRYIPVRRLALFIEDSLQRGLQWVVFEPNDEPLWASVRLNVTAFMSQLHRQGAFQGASARDAFLVKCDSETTTQADINLGILNLYVGFAPVRPAEFVVLQIQQRFQTNA